MSPISANLQPELTEADLIRKAVDKDAVAIRAIIKKHNQRLYRVARSIVLDDGDAEDVLQEAYTKAFIALQDFRGESSLATWLTRIVFNEALQWRRRRIEAPTHALPENPSHIIQFPFAGSRDVDPETSVAQRQICVMMEEAIDNLPDEFRTVLIARVLEDMSIEETATLLGLKSETVKTRLHRARRLLNKDLIGRLGPIFRDVFPFDGARCERMTLAVLRRLGHLAVWGTFDPDVSSNTPVLK
jgi:RNA polymerase sigma-70 factor (ECF subfamily)